MDTTLRELTQEELDTIQLDTDLAYSICKKYVLEFEGTFTSKILSKTFILWLEDKSEIIEKDYDSNFNSSNLKKPTATMIKYALGSAFGEVLNTITGSDWMHVTDQYGKEICIHHKSANYTSFPYSSVEKRIKSREALFFESIENLMKEECLRRSLKSKT